MVKLAGKTSLQTLRILIHTEDVEILGPRFGHLHALGIKTLKP